jgi:hypothetical protein
VFYDELLAVMSLSIAIHHSRHVTLVNLEL